MSLKYSGASSIFPKILARVWVQCAAIGVLASSPLFAQETVKPDPQIAQALTHISPSRVQANIEKLVSFGTRLTLSAQDADSIKQGRGIGAAREWIKSEFDTYSKACTSTPVTQCRPRASRK